jgi:hypothetical protein
MEEPGGWRLSSRARHVGRGGQERNETLSTDESRQTFVA